MIKAVVFDLDDTLYPEEQYVREGFRHLGEIIFEKYNVADAASKLNELFDAGCGKVIDCFFAESKIKIDKEETDALIAAYRGYKRKALRLYPDVKKTLARLRKGGYRLGVITDGREEGQKNKMDVLGLPFLVDASIITDSLGGERFRKPHPESFMRMAAELHVPPAQMLYVGDNREKDFAVAKTLPIKTCEILRQRKIHKTKDYLFGIQPTYTIKTLEDIFDCLQ